MTVYTRCLEKWTDGLNLRAGNPLRCLDRKSIAGGTIDNLLGLLDYGQNHNHDYFIVNIEIRII